MGGPRNGGPRKGRFSHMLQHRPKYWDAIDLIDNDYKNYLQYIPLEGEVLKERFYIVHFCT